MSGMDGLELCRKIRHNPVTNHIPVIILTSSTDETSHLESIDSGADRFLSKPLSIELLRSSIAQVIASRDTMRGKFSGGDIRSGRCSSIRQPCRVTRLLSPSPMPWFWLEMTDAM